MVQCGKTKSKVNTQRSVTDSKFSHLSHVTVISTVNCVVIKR